MLDMKHKLLVFGLHHRRASIDVRECLAFEEKDIPHTLTALSQLPGVSEVAMLSTCNRIEVYAAVDNTEEALRHIQHYLSHSKNVPLASFIPFSFSYSERDAVMHLFRVASGIDSLVLGEDQILGQVKTALRQALHAKTSGRLIHKVFQLALSTGKAVRTETGIATRDISLAKAAFEYSLEHHPELLGKRIGVLGGGKMAEIILHCLADYKAQNAVDSLSVVVANRTEDKAQHLAEKYEFTATSRAELFANLDSVDALFVATASPHYILHLTDFTQQSSPTLIFDISVPRNVDPEVGLLSGVTLYNTDDLSDYSGNTDDNRESLLQLAEAIIEREYENYTEWQSSRLAAPFIMMLRKQFEAIREREFESLLNQNPQLEQLQGSDAIEMLETLSKQLLNKLLHYPIIQLKRMASEGTLSSEAMSGYMNKAMAAALEKTRLEPDVFMPYPVGKNQVVAQTEQNEEEVEQLRPVSRSH